jgi:hypothetical protein
MMNPPQLLTGGKERFGEQQIKFRSIYLLALRVTETKDLHVRNDSATNKQRNQVSVDLFVSSTVAKTKDFHPPAPPPPPLGEGEEANVMHHRIDFFGLATILILPMKSHRSSHANERESNWNVPLLRKHHCWTKSTHVIILRYLCSHSGTVDKREKEKTTRSQMPTAIFHRSNLYPTVMYNMSERREHDSESFPFRLRSTIRFYDPISNDRRISIHPFFKISWSFSQLTWWKIVDHDKVKRRKSEIHLQRQSPV